MTAPCARLEPPDVGESILAEADRLVSGPRQGEYGHPGEDFADTAAINSVLLKAKLKAPLDARDVALFMVGVKLSRESRRPKRDNRVDAAGYLRCLDMVTPEATEYVVTASPPPWAPPGHATPGA